jgi:glyoxylase-like metal-dependent hydrolase (beta-lactamase superfamily II)
MSAGVRLRGFPCGWLETALGGLLKGGGRATIRIPAPAYVVEHPKGTVLFDTGLHPDLRVDAVARIGGLAELFACELPDGTAVDERLDSLSVGPDLVVCSHLHFDHAGGNSLLPDVRVVVQRAEWEAAHGEDPLGAYAAHDFDTGQDIQLVDGEHDVFGDGTVVCIPTPGHTAGHQSLRVRTDGGEVVLTGDSCYFLRSLEERALPPFGHDHDEQLRSLDLLASMRAAGARLVFGHDPDQWSGDEVVDLT